MYVAIIIKNTNNFKCRKIQLKYRFKTGGLMDKKGIEYDEIKTG